jgi:hypothetical protein
MYTFILIKKTGWTTFWVIFFTSASGHTVWNRWNSSRKFGMTYRLKQIELRPGLPDGIFTFQKFQIWVYLESLQKENVGIFYCHLVFCAAIWYFVRRFGIPILWSFGILCATIWHILWSFGIFFVAIWHIFVVN